MTICAKRAGGVVEDAAPHEKAFVRQEEVGPDLPSSAEPAAVNAGHRHRTPRRRYIARRDPGARVRH